MVKSPWIVISVRDPLWLITAMVVALDEQERQRVQENSLFFSTLDVDNSRLVSATDVIGGLKISCAGS